MDTDALAQKLYDASLAAPEVPLEVVQRMLGSSDPGHEAIDNPGAYRWFLVRRFPVQAFGITLQKLMKEAGSAAGNEKFRHDRILELLKGGALAWPALVTASGIVVDGYHRIAAHRSARDKFMDVLVAVKRSAGPGDTWDEMWNHAVSGEQGESEGPILYHGTLVEHLPEISRKGLEETEGWGGAGTRGVFLSGTPQGALYWAKMAYQRANGGKLEVHSFDRDHGAQADSLLAVIEVRIPAEYADVLKADEEQFEDVGADFPPDDWRQSLEKIGDVRFAGAIPARWLGRAISPSEIPAKRVR